MANAWIIVNGRIIDPASNRDEQGDLLVLHGRIASPGTPVPDGDGRGA